MVLPNRPITLTPESVADLNRKLGEMRHEINNHLSLIVAATELLQRKPELLPRATEALSQQPQRIAEAVQQFSTELERLLEIKRG